MPDLQLIIVQTPNSKFRAVQMPLLLYKMCPCGNWCRTYVPVEHRFTLQYMRVHMLLKKTVDEDRQGSETNIVQSQVYTVIERLQRKAKSILCLGIYEDLLAHL